MQGVLNAAWWTLEVWNQDGGVEHRIGNCQSHMQEMFVHMSHAPAQDNEGWFFTMRRWLDSDGVLEFWEPQIEDDEEVTIHDVEDEDEEVAGWGAFA
jgi:hypothetical protein